MFNIEFISAVPEEDDGGLITLVGEITLGKEIETFRSALSLWSREDYERQWREAAQRLFDGEERSAFITSAFQFWRPMWQDEDDIRVQDQFLLPERLASLGPAPNPSRTPYELIGDYTRTNEDGEAISEWRISLRDIEVYLRGW